VDNLCHTLVGAAFGEAGLKRRTRYANVTLMISANAPDVDVLSFLIANVNPISFRRGWTHGVIAQLVLPIALSTVTWAVGRVLARRGPDRADRPPLHFGWLLALSYVGVYSHVFLDYLNNYGVRLLAPFDWRWFYGDALFIADVWLWLALGAGIWLSRRQRRVTPARGALIFAGFYIAAMLASAQASRGIVTTTWRETRSIEPRAVMVGPVPLTPFTRAVIVDEGDRYQTGVFRWWTAGVALDPEPILKNAGDPRVAVATAESDSVRQFLVWARFPFWTFEPDADGSRVNVMDVRFMGPARRMTFVASAVVKEER
jgi:inner membrane protein